MSNPPDNGPGAVIQQFALGRQQDPTIWSGFPTIVYKKITFSSNTTGQGGQAMDVEFAYHDDSQVFTDRPLNTLIEVLRRGGSVPQLVGGGGTPLDFELKPPCFVVIQLDGSRNWQFRTDGDAVTTKASYSGDYCALMQVYEDGDILAGYPQKDGCRIAYFSAIGPMAARDDGFNFHIELTQNNNKDLPLLIDPDIHNDGHG